MEHPKPGFYRHFKNHKLYRVLGVAVHTETLEDIVVYEPQYENDLLGERGAQFFARPLSMFVEEVEQRRQAAEIRMGRRRRMINLHA